MSVESKRRYRKRKRAETEEETHRRITEAAVELHGTVGPARTTITEVAERAGVSRMTVYNHFPSDVDLFRACSSHWARENPFPDPEGWLAGDPEAWVVHALEELYGWYDRKQGMLEKVLRDLPLVPSLGEVMEPLWGDYMEDVVDALLRGWREGRDGNGPLRATLRVVADFHTWRLLDEAGLSAADAARVAAQMAVATTPAAPSSTPLSRERSSSG